MLVFLVVARGLEPTIVPTFEVQGCHYGFRVEGFKVRGLVVADSGLQNFRCVSWFNV